MWPSVGPEGPACHAALARSAALDLARSLLNDEYMNRVGAGILAFALLFLAQPDIAAYARGGGGGMGAHSFHFSGHFRASHRHGHFARHNLNQNMWPWYGGYGYYTLPASTYGDDAVTSSVPVMYVPVRVSSCHKIQEAMTVPSEEGGTRQVTVTRCEGS
jgi:hypothetical protein